MDSSTIYLVRHGQTALNAQGRFRGRSDPPLDEVGREQARAVARTLAEARILRIYSSPLTRANQTAEPLAAALDLPIVLDPSLIDVDYGEWNEMTGQEARTNDPGNYAIFREDPMKAQPPGGEALAAVAERVTEAIGRYTAECPGGALALISHDVPIRLALVQMLKLPGGSMWVLDVPTGSCTRVFSQDGVFRVDEEFRPVSASLPN